MQSALDMFMSMRYTNLRFIIIIIIVVINTRQTTAFITIQSHEYVYSSMNIHKDGMQQCT